MPAPLGLNARGEKLGKTIFMTLGNAILFYKDVGIESLVDLYDARLPRPLHWTNCVATLLH